MLETPLHIAARMGHEEHVVYFASLSGEKINLNVGNKDDDTGALSPVWRC